MQQRAKLRCDECGDWVPVEQTDGRVTCDCGRGFLITITPMPSNPI